MQVRSPMKYGKPSFAEATEGRRMVINMKLNKSSKANLSKYMMYGSVVAVLFAAEAWIGPDIWLAATQWLLVALVLVAFAIYLKLA